MNTDINTLIEERKKVLATKKEQERQEALTWVIDQFILKDEPDYIVLSTRARVCIPDVVFSVAAQENNIGGLPCKRWCGPSYDTIVIWKSEEGKQKWEEDRKAEASKKRYEEREAWDALPFWRKLFTHKPTQETN